MVLDVATPLGDRLRLERLRLRLSQVAMGEKVGLSDSYISQLEKGRKTPSNETLKSIALKLDLDINELAALADIIPTPEGDETIIVPASQAPDVRRFAKLKPWVQRMGLGLINQVLENSSERKEDDEEQHDESGAG